jgi:cell wall assembly regulator SMI1
MRIVRLASLVTVTAGAMTLMGGVAHATSGPQIAQIAYAQLGKGCSGNGWQCDPDEWCADFAKWVWQQAGVNTTGLTAGAGSFATYGQANGTIVTTPLVGDAIVYGYNGSGYAGHVNLVYAVNAADQVETIGGNQGASPGIVSLDSWHSVEQGAVIVAPVGISSPAPGGEITGDWDGNGTSTPGIYRDGTFYLRNENSQGVADITFAYGDPGWTPISGDWDGTGKTSVGVYDPSTGTFYLRSNTNPGGGFTTTSFVYGDPGWIPITGDWDGSGKTSVGVYDPSTGTFYLRSNADPGTNFTTTTFVYGNPGWTPITGDWNGTGKTSVGAYDPSTGTFYLRSNAYPGDDFSTNSFVYGDPGWVPLTGNWTGTGTITIGAYDPSTSDFYLRDSNSQGNADIAFQYGDPQST